MTLSEFKQRLEVLPERQKVANQGQLFDGFCEKVAKARRKTTDAITAARHAKLALGTFDDKEVVARARQAGGRAARLHRKLGADAASVGERDVEAGFASLVSEADTAYSRCTSMWTTSLATKLTGRAALANVLTKVLPQEGREMQKIVRDLEQNASRLPLTEAQALQVRNLFDYFDTLMNKIGLSDKVGEFLKDVAGSNGAPLKSLENAKVQAFLDEHKLRDVFRIRLQ
jgi:hypothetical protein